MNVNFLRGIIPEIDLNRLINLIRLIDTAFVYVTIMQIFYRLPNKGKHLPLFFQTIDIFFSRIDFHG